MLITFTVIAKNEFMLSVCSCVNSSITFECTTVGPGATIWKGSAFDCRTSLNQIQLLHSQFEDGRASGTCNDGRIVGYGLDVSEDLHFRSRLDVQVTSAAMNGTRVECDYDNGAEVHSILRRIIVLITGKACPDAWGIP